MEIYNKKGELLFTGEKKDLKCANLENANLFNANLGEADLENCILKNADLSYANLFNTNLRCANLENADLRYANLKNAKYSYISILKMFIDTKNPDLILELMLWDAESCGVEKMDLWVETNRCPFSDSQRDFYFPENKEIWKNRNRDTKKYKTLRELFIAIAEDLKIRI